MARRPQKDCRGRDGCSGTTANGTVAARAATARVTVDNAAAVGRPQYKQLQQDPQQDGQQQERQAVRDARGTAVGQPRTGRPQQERP